MLSCLAQHSGLVGENLASSDSSRRYRLDGPCHSISGMRVDRSNCPFLARRACPSAPGAHSTARSTCPASRSAPACHVPHPACSTRCCSNVVNSALAHFAARLPASRGGSPRRCGSSLAASFAPHSSLLHHCFYHGCCCGLAATPTGTLARPDASARRIPDLPSVLAARASHSASADSAHPTSTRCCCRCPSRSLRLTHKCWCS